MIVAKAEKHGKTSEELDTVIKWTYRIYLIEKLPSPY